MSDQRNERDAASQPLVQRAYMPDEWVGKLIPIHAAFKRVPPDLKITDRRPRAKRQAAKRPRLAKFVNVKIKKWVD